MEALESDMIMAIYLFEISTMTRLGSIIFIWFQWLYFVFFVVN